MKILHGLLIILLLIVAMSSWQDWLSPRPAPDSTIEMAERKSDYYLEAFTIDTYAATGKLEHRLSGKTLTHYPRDDTAEIEALHLLLKRQGQPDWSVSSQSGWVESGATRMELRGEVAMIRGEAPGRPRIRIDSHDVRLDTQKHRVETDAPFLMVSDRWQARGTGFRGNIESGDFSLLANVEYTYAPPL